eukprot:SAG11_NODE_29_length_23137_cov_16.739995_14_plen_135_part_00
MTLRKDDGYVYPLEAEDADTMAGWHESIMRANLVAVTVPDASSLLVRPPSVSISYWSQVRFRGGYWPRRWRDCVMFLINGVLFFYSGNNTDPVLLHTVSLEADMRVTETCTVSAVRAGSVVRVVSCRICRSRHA